MYLSIDVSIQLSIYASVHLSIHLSIDCSIHLSILLFPKVLHILQARAKSPRAKFTYELSHPKITDCLYIYWSLFVCKYPSIYLPIYLYIDRSTDLFMYLCSIPERIAHSTSARPEFSRQFIHTVSNLNITDCLSVNLSIILSVYLSICLSIYPSIYPSVNLFFIYASMGWLRLVGSFKL